MSKVQKLALAGLFVALDIVFARFLSFYLPDPVSRTVRVSPQFLAHALSGWMLGPLWAAVSALAGDMLGMLVNSGGLVFQPGFSISFALSGAIYGLALHRREVRWQNALIAVSAVTIPISLLLNSIWLHLLYKAATYTYIVTALPWRLLTIPIYFVLLIAVQKGILRSSVIKR